jgi:hypothetical protein
MKGHGFSRAAKAARLDTDFQAAEKLVRAAGQDW